MQEDNKGTKLKGTVKRHTANILQDVEDDGVSPSSSYLQHPYNAYALAILGTRAIPSDFASQFRLSMERENSGFSDQ